MHFASSTRHVYDSLDDALAISGFNECDSRGNYCALEVMDDDACVTVSTAEIRRRLQLGGHNRVLFEAAARTSVEYTSLK